MELVFSSGQVAHTDCVLRCIAKVLQSSKCTSLQLSTAYRTPDVTSGHHYIDICRFVHLYSVCPINLALPVNPTKPAMLQLLSSSQPQAESHMNAASQMIQEYGQALTVKDARLALEYYWQAAAVLGGTTSVKVLSYPLLYCPMCDSTSCDSKCKAVVLCCTVFLFFAYENRCQLGLSWRC